MRRSMLGLAFSVALAACGPATATLAPTAATGGEVPLGSWTTTISEADARAAGITEPGGIAENTGTFTLTIAGDGTWTAAQVAAQPPRTPVFSGTYRVTGADAFEMTTTFPQEYAGDVVAVRWARQGDALALHVVSPDDPLLRLNLETHPWSPKP